MIGIGSSFLLLDSLSLGQLPWLGSESAIKLFKDFVPRDEALVLEVVSILAQRDSHVALVVHAPEGKPIVDTLLDLVKFGELVIATLLVAFEFALLQLAMVYAARADKVCTSSTLDRVMDYTVTQATSEVTQDLSTERAAVHILHNIKHYRLFDVNGILIRCNLHI